MSIYVLYPFLNWTVILLLSSMSSSYLLNTDPLSDNMICKYFSPIPEVAYLFCWWFPFLCLRSSFRSSVPLIFAFVFFAFGTKSKKSPLRLMSRSMPPIFYSRTFKVSGLMFKSLFHFELVFVYGVDSSPVFTTFLLKRLSLLYTLGSSVIN